MIEENENQKTTQGQKKMLQYFEDLKRNKHFKILIKRLEKISEENSKKKDENYEKLMEEFIRNYQELDQLLKKRMKLSNKSQEIIMFIAEEYGLTSEITADPIVFDFLSKDESKYSIWNDMCAVSDNYDFFLNEVFSRPVPIELDTAKQSHIRAYPISIDIHKFATKRDVLDYIEKRWNFIESYLEVYRDKNVRFRKRKIERKVVDYIWENKKEPAKKIVELIAKKFLDNNLNLGYEDILKIISNEKNRRIKKIRKLM